ncbi:MAG: glycoside hydrolase family 31 protein [Blautia sp.]|nr:glycoside hydrolase family 31 protein [Blautia sp.]MDY5031081.1 glycoside hydrolase family 31 protein [Blautia sp.]
MQEIYRVNTRPAALSANMVTGEKYRITMLTEGLVRLEYCEDGLFEDRATQMVFYRDFPETKYRLIRNEDGIEIHTSRLHLVYNEKEFSGHGLRIQLKGNISAYHSIWHYGEEIHDLKGTARTLDEADGAVELGSGVVSWFGFSVLDDSRSQVLLPDGWIEPRKKGVQDLYFFGYGHDYKEALKDFYRLCGTTPMLPRFALGNWWSRYYRYSEKSYLELMNRFAGENLPFTVAVIDMDWHLVDIDPKYGSGWTGYTWNRELFPDPKRFLDELHSRGMKTTLNVHPADGVQAHEEMYEEIAREMGVNVQKEDPVLCDPADPKFMEAYFRYLHHPREEEGVDFWWIDWQQGSNCKIEGLDPLWIFNHYHFLDSKRNGKRPLTFSRYAGPGSHRYPVGFSGDTVITWESLEFQPYFTQTASNIGFGWWSHDIGGHMLGYKNDELMARWTQLGVFSPIMRLHSSSSEFNGKEPWRYKKETEVVMGDMLRLRHAMIPYLYTMNHRSFEEKLPLILPMYYENPEERYAYEVKNEFWFGTEMIVAPVTQPRISGLNMAKVRVWLPDGIWYDKFTGLMYRGNRMLDMYRTLDSIPVLVKAGGILPFTDETENLQAIKNPVMLRIYVFAGADGAFELYEDDNETCRYEAGQCVVTKMTYTEGPVNEFVIASASGDLSLIPGRRSYVVELTGYEEEAVETVRVSAGGNPVMPKQVSYEKQKKAVVVELPETSVQEEVRIQIAPVYQAVRNDVEERCFDFLNQAEIGFLQKDQLFARIREEKDVTVLAAEFSAMDLDHDLYGILMELLTAR